MQIPTIDMSPLFGTGAGRAETAAAIGDAAGRFGFFKLKGHGIPLDLFDRIERESAAFFALPAETKARIAMAHGGPAWRGWFPLEGELTSGLPDRKEGLYLGEELGPGDPRVAAGWPMHGPNLWPREAPGLRPAVGAWLSAATRAAHALCEGAAIALGLPEQHFHDHYTARPTLLFRIFRYPPDQPGSWGVGEHSDYGFLTLLAQSRHGGLEVRTDDGWIEVPPEEGTLVVNVGDMLDRLTAGRWRSAPHRVRNPAPEDRYSWPLFFDPAFDARIEPLPGFDPPDIRPARWDGLDLAGIEGPYGDYLLGKVGKVFPDLAGAVRFS